MVSRAAQVRLVMWVAALIVLSAPSPGPAAEASDPRIVHFAPQGIVKGVRQVTARFSEPMVPLGDPRVTADPFEIDCPEPGTARWVDSRTWAYDFARDLPAGIRCRFELRPGLKTLSGLPVAGGAVFTFSTGGPAIRSSRPHEGATWVDEEQAFVLVLDAEPTDESVLASVSFSVEGVPERVGVRLVEGAARETILKSLGGGPAGPVVVLQARQRFPSGARVNLIWGRGVTSRSGVPTDRDQVLAFRTREAFKAAFTCERENRRAGCLPLADMTVEFSAPVARESARRVGLVDAGGRRWAPTLDEAPFVRRAVFKGPFPEATAFRVELPPGLVDDAGRPLVNESRFPLPVKTGELPPLAKFPARFGIVEKADPTLPVTLRNLEPSIRARLLQVDREQPADLAGRAMELLGRVTGRVWRVPPEQSEEILLWLRKVAVAGRQKSLFGSWSAGRSTREFTLPKPNGARAFEVVGIPLPGPGLYVVELESARLGASLLGRSSPMYVPAAALVTNLGVHFKWGREDSLAWVTTLDAGDPVPGAEVAVYDCRGTALWNGKTDQQGIARIGKLPEASRLPRCAYPAAGDWWGSGDDITEALGDLDGGLLVTARTPDDLSFVHSSWDRGIEPWRFQLPSEPDHGPIAAHTILDRSLLRAGERVHMKHLIRLQRPDGFAPVPEDQRPARLLIRHLGSDEEYELPLEWDAAGVAESAWTIPKEARLGTYEIVLAGRKAVAKGGPAEAGSGEGRKLISGQFRVEEFRVPLMKGVIQPPAAPQVAVTEVPVDLSVRYLAGGGAGGLPVTLRAQLRPRPAVAFSAFEGFVFANGPVEVGLVQQRAASFDEEEAGDGEEGDEEEDGAARSSGRDREGVHQRSELVLDAAGTARAAITRLPRASRPQELLAELEFRDPNGEVQTVSTTVTLWPSRRLVGIKPDSWLASRERLRVQVAVADVSGRPVRGASVQVELLQRKVYSYRKRLVGGFYAYEHAAEVRRLGEFCRGVTDARGLLFCEGKPMADGNLVLQARLAGGDGAAGAAHRDVWIAGSEEWWFRVADSDRMDVLPEQKRYEPGETARLQVRMPFREATALVAVEREGAILEASVVRLAGKEPVVEVPVRPTYAPNVFVSVLAVRGRVGGVQPTALVDLGRPAFKLGVAEVRVGWRAHELKVKVSPARATYRVREKAAVRVAVRTADGQAPPPGSEVAIAAVDEGLLELLPNPSWNVLDAMMGQRWHGIDTSTAQMQVVGKRHYGLKALPQGGGGGRQTTRELFDTLLLWKGRVPLGASGDATVEIPLNDSLTAFRIVAIATGGVGLFGTGSATIRTTQELMILPGIAPLVREGDRFRSEFTLRNTTGRTMEVEVSGRVEGVAPPGTTPPAESPRQWPLESRAVTLGPGEARSVGWEVAAPVGIEALRYEVEARPRSGRPDRVRATQQVRPAVPVRTFQATLARWAPGTRQPVERPADAIPGRGGVQVVLSPSLAGSLDGVREWMRNYPYVCLEQKVSKAVALRDERMWREIAGAMPSYLDPDGLLKYFPTMWWGSEVLTAYVLALAHESGWEIPDEVRTRAVAGLRRFVEGSIVRRSALPTADLTIRKLAALEALSRYGAVEPRLLGSLAIEPNLWPTSAVLDWWSLLHRVEGIPDREARLREAEHIVRARLDLQGTTMRFSTERSDDLWWLMVSPDTNAVRLVLVLLETGGWQEDLPRLVRGAIGRQRRGAWDLTVTNVWGALAVEKFSRAFESTPVTGTTAASLAGAVERLDWAQAAGGGTLALAWPAGRAELAVDHTGSGRPWVTVQSRAAVPLAAPLSSGYRIAKTVMPIEPREPGRLSRGDLVRVRLEIEAQSDMTWVVVSDPVPAGASHLGTGLGRDSQIAVQGERRTGWAWPAFEERSFEAFRAYYEYVPKGRFAVEYTIRLNQSGRFELPPTRVEALYAPEMFGELPNAAVEVSP